jgi:hypothetical protein
VEKAGRRRSGEGLTVERKEDGRCGDIVERDSWWRGRRTGGAVERKAGVRRGGAWSRCCVSFFYFEKLW